MMTGWRLVRRPDAPPVWGPLFRVGSFVLLGVATSRAWEAGERPGAVMIVTAIVLLGVASAADLRKES